MSQDMKQTETKDDKQKDCGAIWERSGKNGVYFSIDIQGKKYLAFKNKWKKKDNQPDYRVFENTFTKAPAGDSLATDVPF